jgi:hypothetical protein
MTASGIEIFFAEGMRPEQSAAVQAYIKHFEEKIFRPSYPASTFPFNWE